MRNLPGACSGPLGSNVLPPRAAACGLRPSRVPRLLPLAVLLGSLCSASAVASPLEPLHLYAGLSWFHDDNLFRLSDDAEPFDGRRGDSARQSVVGLFIDKQYSRQKILVQAKRSKVAFEHFKQLDYTGKDYLARWNWELGNHLSGTAGASYLQSLAPYTDFRRNERNLREQRREFFDGNWRFHPSWRLRAAANRERYEYELRVQRVNDRTDSATEVGIDYLAKSGSTAGVVARRFKGEYTNERVSGSFRLDDSFVQDELKARIDWRVTPISTVSVLAGRVERTYDGPTARTVSGFNGRVSVLSQTRAKLRLTGALFREFTPVESNIVSYALSRGASLGATWEASAKVRVDANATRERLRYEASRIEIDPARLEDTRQRASLNATWAPRQSVQFNAGLSHEKRSGSVFGSGGYTANTVSVGANAQF